MILEPGLLAMPNCCYCEALKDNSAACFKNVIKIVRNRYSLLILRFKFEALLKLSLILSPPYRGHSNQTPSYNNGGWGSLCKQIWG